MGANQCDKIEALSVFVAPQSWFHNAFENQNYLDWFPMLSFQMRHFTKKSTPISDLVVSNISSSPAETGQPAWKIQMGH